MTRNKLSNGDYRNIIDRATKILIIGMGGGVDIVSTLIVARILDAEDKKIIFGSTHKWPFQSFSGLTKFNNSVGWVNSHTRLLIQERFAEPYIAEKLNQEIVLVTQEHGVQGMSKDFNEFIASEKIDLVIFTDTGFDSIVTGDEDSLGSPRTDQSTLALAKNVKCKKILSNLGFGVEPEISHYYILRNIARIVEKNGFLGASGISAEMTQDCLSLINDILSSTLSSTMSSLREALLGKFGFWKNPAPWTKGEVFISPLMLVIFYFDIDIVSDLSPLAQLVRNTTSRKEIENILDDFNSVRKKGVREIIPL